MINKLTIITVWFMVRARYHRWLIDATAVARWSVIFFFFRGNCLAKILRGWGTILWWPFIFFLINLLEAPKALPPKSIIVYGTGWVDGRYAVFCSFWTKIIVPPHTKLHLNFDFDFSFDILQYPELNAMIMRRFQEPGDAERAFELVHKSQGLEQTRFLAKKHCLEATRLAGKIAESPYQKSLLIVPDLIVNRMK